MLKEIRDAGSRVKKFAQDHPTVTACVVTGVVSAKVSSNLTAQRITKQVYEFTYSAGYHVGAMEIQNAILFDFIKSRNLTDDLDAFVRMMKDSGALKVE